MSEVHITSYASIYMYIICRPVTDREGGGGVRGILTLPFPKLNGSSTYRWAYISVFDTQNVPG